MNTIGSKLKRLGTADSIDPLKEINKIKNAAESAIDELMKLN
jgi:hypothetical protein